MANNSNISVTSTTVNNLVPTVKELTRKYNDLLNKYETLVNFVNSGETTSMTQMSSKLNKLTTSVNNLNTRVNNIDLTKYVRSSEFSSLAADHNDLKDTVDDVKTTSGKANDIDSLSNSLSNLAIKVTNAETNIAQMQDSIDAVNATINTEITNSLNNYPTASEIRNAINRSTRNASSITTINSNIRTLQTTSNDNTNLINRLSAADEAIISSLETKVSEAEYLGLVNAVNAKASHASFAELVENVRSLTDKIDDELPQNMEDYSELLYNDIRRRQEKLISVLEFVFEYIKRQENMEIMNAKIQAKNEMIQKILNGETNPETGSPYDIDDMNNLINEAFASVDDDYSDMLSKFTQAEDALNYLVSRPYISTSGDNTSNYTKINFVAPSVVLEKQIDEYLPAYLTGGVDESLRSYIINKTDELNNNYYHIKDLSYAYVKIRDSKINSLMDSVASYGRQIIELRASRDQLASKVTNDIANASSRIDTIRTRADEAINAATEARTNVSNFNTSLTSLTEDIDATNRTIGSYLTANKNFAYNLAKTIYGENPNVITYIVRLHSTTDDTESLALTNELAYSFISNNASGLTTFVNSMVKTNTTDTNYDTVRNAFETESSAALNTFSNKFITAGRYNGAEATADDNQYASINVGAQAGSETSQMTQNP